MLNGNGNENGTKINRSNQQKKKKKKNLPVQDTFSTRLFVFLRCCFARLQCRFVRLKRQTFQLHIIFMEELSYVLTKDFVSCVHFRFYSFNAAYFHLVTSISHVLTAAMKFSCFSSHEKSSFPQLFLFYPREYKHQKKKDTIFLFFLFSSVAFGLSYLLIEIFYIVVPVVRTDGRSVGRAVYVNVITKFSRMGRFTQLWGSARAWSSAINFSHQFYPPNIL